MATDAPPLVSRINNVHLYVSDMARSLAFYRDVLGIPLESDAMREEWGTAVEFVAPDGYRLHLFEPPS